MSNITEPGITEAQEAEARAALIAPPTDYQKLYEDKVAENEMLTTVIAASRVATSTPANKSFKPVITADRLRAMVGDLAYHKMPRHDKVVALGGDPTTSDEVLKKAFGRGNDGVFANDLHRSDPRKYALYRELAIGLGLYAK
jgi:hypothetical protein